LSPWPVESLASFLTETPRNGVSPSEGGTVRCEVLTLSAITGATFSESASKEADFKSNPPSSKRVDHRDFLVCRGNGNKHLVGLGFFPKQDLPDVVFPDTMIALRVDSSRINREYLEFAWRSKRVRAQIEAGARTTNGTFKINQGTVGGIQIPVPPIEEQRRIAELLGQADELRVKRRQAISLLDDLARSTFHSMFMDGVAFDRWCCLGETAEIVSGITKGRKLPGGVPRRAIPYLAVVNVQDKHLDLATVKTIEATQVELDRYRLLGNDLLLTEGGDPDKVGRGTLWGEELPEAIHQNHIFRVRLRKDSGIDPVYLSWYVGSDIGKRYFLRSAKQTTGIASINATQLRSFPLPIPPVQLQDLFASRIAGIHDTKSYQEDSLRALDELFTVIQVKAFGGELWQT
jgi:type I restriction enzyme, S subunit